MRKIDKPVTADDIRLDQLLMKTRRCERILCSCHRACTIDRLTWAYFRDVNRTELRLYLEFVHLLQLLTIHKFVSNKRLKVSPYSIMSVGLGADPGLLAVSSQVT